MSVEVVFNVCNVIQIERELGKRDRPMARKKGPLLCRPPTKVWSAVLCV